MSGSKPDILWSPHHPDRYVICDSELGLYRIGPLGSAETKVGTLPLSEETAATLLAINSDTPYMKCVAWYPKHEAECLLAVGQANGRVVLTSLGQSHNSTCKELVGKEFVPKHARQCNTLAWNPVDCNLLAAGLDKHRADFSVLIWDISTKFSPEAGVSAEKIRLSSLDLDSSSVVTKPLYELGQNDACLSLCWLLRDPKLLLAGMHRNLAIFDLRNTSQKTFVNTKAIQGVTVDPHFHDRVASFYEGQVAIWDLRKFEKPVLTLTEQPKPLTKVQDLSIDLSLYRSIYLSIHCSIYIDRSIYLSLIDLYRSIVLSIYRSVYRSLLRAVGHLFMSAVVGGVVSHTYGSSGHADP